MIGFAGQREANTLSVGVLQRFHRIVDQIADQSDQVIGEVDTLSSDTLYMYCKSGSQYYCINLIVV